MQMHELVMSDGTFYKDSHGQTYNYAERWAYGYIVGVESLAIIPGDRDVSELVNVILAIPNNTRYGVWTNPNTGVVYVDRVEHIDTRHEAIDRAESMREHAIYDLRDRRVIYISDWDIKTPSVDYVDFYED